MSWLKKPKEHRKVNFSSNTEEAKSSSVLPTPAQASMPIGIPTTSTMLAPYIPPLSTIQEDQVAARLGGNIRSVLSEGTVINGKLSFDTPVKIDGKLTGEVFSSKALVVGRTGKINAKIDVESLIIMGEVEGSVLAKDKIEVMPGGRLSADIETKSLIITDAEFNGSCKMR
ncbi:MAG: polymer-forming cytoskeletal protein [bacterium]|nr:polymer-forming cytoskeletal protein [bacterium]